MNTDLGRNGSVTRIGEEDVLGFEIGVDETKSVEIWERNANDESESRKRRLRRARRGGRDSQATLVMSCRPKSWM